MIVDDLSHRKSLRIFSLQRLARSLGRGDNPIENLFRRLAQFFTLASTFVGQQRIPTHDQSFTRKMLFVGDLRQILFVEQRPGDFACIDQRSNAFCPQCRNPVEPLHVSQILVDPFGRNHAVIAHEHHIRDAESLANFRDDAGESSWVCRVAREHVDGARTPFPGHTTIRTQSEVGHCNDRDCSRA